MNLRLMAALPLIVAILFLSGCSIKNSDNPVIATVGEREIPFSTFYERYSKYLHATGIRDNFPTREFVLDNIITEELLYHYDTKYQIKSTEDYKTNREWIKRQTVLSFLKDREVYAKLTASEEEMRNAFKRANQRLSARHLYAETEEEAKQLYTLVKSGVSFDLLAKKVFTDSTLANNGGYIGYFSWGDMDPAFEDAAYKLKPGEISEPVKTEFGYSVIKLEDKVTRPLLTENEFRRSIPALSREVKIYKKPLAERQYIQSLVNFEDIEFDESQLTNLFNRLGGNRIRVASREVNHDKPVMKYAGKEYNYADVAKRLNHLPDFHLQKLTTPRRLAVALQGFVLQDKLWQVAESKNYTNNEEVLDAFCKLDINLVVKMKKNEIVEDAVIPDSIVRRFYEEHIRFFSTHNEVNVQEITLNNEDEAKKVLSRAKQGADFNNLVTKYSVNKKTSQNNGFTGFIPVKNFLHAGNMVWNSKIGEVVGPVESGNKWLVLKIADKMEGKPLPFMEVREEALLAAKYFNSNKLMHEYVQTLKEDIPVKIDTSILAGYKKLGLVKTNFVNSSSKKGVN